MGEKNSKTEPMNEYAEEVLTTIRQIIQAIDQHSRTLMKHYGLTVPQLVILKTVAKEESLTVGNLAKKVSLSQATVTGIIERLYQRGLVFRTRGTRDRRRVFIKPNKKCHDLLEKAPPPMQDIFVRHFSEIEEWERLMLLSSLKKITQLMDIAPHTTAPPYLITGEVLANSEIEKK